MKRVLLMLAVLMGAMAGLASAPALARGHVGVGFYFGGPGYYGSYYGGPGWGPGYYGDPYYYGPRYYYPPPVVYAPAPVYVQPAAPTQYVEQPQAAPAPAPVPQQSTVTDNEGDDSWYYCSAQKKYYPYVKSCPSGWTRVPARPDDGR